MYFWTTSKKYIHYKPIRYAPIVSPKRGSGSPDSVHVDSHMRCLLFKKTLSNQYIFIKIEILFISNFNAFTLCKYEAYFALNLFCGVITLCKNAWHKSLTVPTGASEISPPYFSLSALLFSRCLDVSHRVNRRRRRHIVFVVTVVTL